MEAVKENSCPYVMLTAVLKHQTSDHIELRLNEPQQPSKNDYALQRAHNLNDPQAGFEDKSANTVDADSRRSDSGVSDRLFPLSSSWKHRLSRSSFVKRLAFAVTGNEPSSFRSGGDHNEKSRPWRTTFIRFGPLSGLFCLILALVSLVASLGILAGSNQQAVDSWAVTPSTFIAIFTAIANLSMRYAAFQGVVIAWWFRASRGSTFAKLHLDWRAGMTLRGALSAGRQVGLLGLACIFSTVVVIDGPLLQRSTSVVAMDHTIPVHLDVTMAPEIPTDFTGTWFKEYDQQNTTVHTTVAFNDTIPTPHGTASNFLQTDVKWNMYYASKPWRDQLPLEGVVRGCPSALCKAKIKAPALFATACTSQIVTTNFDTKVDLKSIFLETTAPPLENDFFLIAVNLVLEGSEVINLVTGYWTGNSDCEGPLNITTCTLESGIGEYDVLLDHDQATVEPESALRPRFVAFANNTAVNHDQIQDFASPSTLGGISCMMSNLYLTVGFAYQTGDGLSGQIIGTDSPQQWMDLSADAIQKCPSYTDPTDDLLRIANMLMIYTGAVAGKKLSSDELKQRLDPGLAVNSTVIGNAYEKQNVFHTNYWYFLGAAIVEIVCVALVAPTYWGWWQLGRPVSLSPLEMAQAFESPLLAEYDSNASGRDLANAAGERRIRYGAKASSPNTGEMKLAFADPALIDKPQRGERYKPSSLTASE